MSFHEIAFIIQRDNQDVELLTNDDYLPATESGDEILVNILSQVMNSLINESQNINDNTLVTIVDHADYDDTVFHLTILHDDETFDLDCEIIFGKQCDPDLPLRSGLLAAAKSINNILQNDHK